MDMSIKKKESQVIDFDFDEINTFDDTNFDAVENTLRNATSVGSATQAGLQTVSLQTAIDKYALVMNQSAIAKSTGLPVKTPSAQYKGFVAEEHHKLTLEINSVAKGIPDYKLNVFTKGTLPDGSNLSGIDMETDISIWTRKHPWSKPIRTVDYQSKMYNDPTKYTKLQSNAQYEAVELVGAAGNEIISDTVQVNIGKKAVASDAISNQEAEKLADMAKAQETPDYQKTSEKHGELNKINLGRAIAAGAATGLILTTVAEIIDIIKQRDDLSEDQFIKSVTHILCGTAEGGIRGGAIMGSVQLLSKVVGKEVAANSLGALPVMIVANTAVDFAKDLYKCFVTEELEADDLLCNTVSNTFSSIAGYGGGYLSGQIVGVAFSNAVATGATIGSALGPIGTIVGSIVGAAVIGCGANAIIRTSYKDAEIVYNECIEEINTHIELSGNAKLYYFIDSMSSISDFRLSFKNLLPCYNLISDLREYSFRKKAIKSIHEQLDARTDGVETEKADILRKLETQQIARIKELKAGFKEQRTAKFDEFKESLDNYIAFSFSQYIGLFDVISGDVASIKESLKENMTNHNAILYYAGNRNKINSHLNDILADIMNDPDSAQLLKPFVEKLEFFMQQDKLLVGKQYLSFDEAINLVSGGQS